MKTEEKKLVEKILEDLSKMHPDTVKFLKELIEKDKMNVAKSAWHGGMAYGYSIATERHSNEPNFEEWIKLRMK